MLNFKSWIMYFFLAMVIAMVSAEASKVHDFTFASVRVGDLIGDDNEMLMDSESNRRTLAGRKRRYISYGALRLIISHVVKRDDLTTIATLEVRLTLIAVVALPSHIVPERSD